MFRRALLLLLALVLFATGCSRSEGGTAVAEPRDCPPPSAPAPTPSPGFHQGRALLPGEHGAVLIDIEIAETPDQRSLGLMFRECLPEDAGMAFIWFEPNTGGFWMKNTLIPLSIAFFDAEGRIVKVMDMEPCKADPCETYDPGVEYMGALEVNQGMFERWGVGEGTEIQVLQNNRDRLSP